MSLVIANDRLPNAANTTHNQTNFISNGFLDLIHGKALSDKKHRSEKFTGAANLKLIS